MSTETIDELLQRLGTAAKANGGPMARGILLMALRGLERRPVVPCEWRGAVLEKASCGCADRNIYQCKHPAAAIDGKPAPVSGAICRGCKYRAAPEK